MADIEDERGARIAAELGEDGVQVNAICPGAVSTAIYGRAVGMDGDQAQRTLDFMTTALSNAAPIRRAGMPADIAEAALWLAGEGAAYVDGQAIAVDGGLLTGPLRRNRATDREGLRKMLFEAAGLPPAEQD